MTRRGRQLQVWYDEATYRAIEDAADDAEVKVTHYVEALGRLVRDGHLSKSVLKRLGQEAKAVRNEREARSGRHRA